jgi:hypothetical protein
MGEASTAPHLRCPAFDSELQRKFLAIALEIGVEPDGPTQFGEAVVHFWFMAFKSIAPQIKNFYVDCSGDITQPLVCWKRDYTIVYNEQSMLQRRSTVHGSVTCNEQLCVYSKTALEPGLNLPVTKRDEPLVGSSLGQNIQGCGMVEHSKTWSMSFAKKKICYGKRRKDVGGKTEGLDTTKVRHPSTEEPFSFWVMSDQIVNALLDEYQVAGSIDFSADCGMRAMQHIISRRPYLGVCWSKQHAEMLQAHLTDRVFELMLDNDSSLFEPTLKKLVNGNSKDGKPAKAEKKEKAEKKDKLKPAKKDQAKPAKPDEEGTIQSGKRKKNPEEANVTPAAKRKKADEEAASSKKALPAQTRDQLNQMLQGLRQKASAGGDSTSLMFEGGDDASESDDATPVDEAEID